MHILTNHMLSELPFILTLPKHIFCFLIMSIMEIAISQSLGGIFMNECAFALKDPIYLDYHDNVWGKPLYDSKALFKLWH